MTTAQIKEYLKIHIKGKLDLTEPSEETHSNMASRSGYCSNSSFGHGDCAHCMCIIGAHDVGHWLAYSESRKKMCFF